jgi:hypothetical protein
LVGVGWAFAGGVCCGVEGEASGTLGDVGVVGFAGFAEFTGAVG